MEMNTATPHSLLDNLRIGFTVWLGEIRFMLANAGRSFEVRQLEKRLMQECAKLGSATADHLTETEEEAAAPSFEMIRTARQVQFLKDEIERLRRQQAEAAEQR